jgi:hypothetical protein
MLQNAIKGCDYVTIKYSASSVADFLSNVSQISTLMTRKVKTAQIDEKKTQRNFFCE